MNILALDTTSEFGSIALRVGGETAAERAIHSPDGFAHVIFREIEELLRNLGIRLSDIDCFAAASGPGSFTGIRVALAAVKGLADATCKRTAGISNLRVLASFGNSGRRAVVLDARRGEVYAGIYDSELQPLVPENVLQLSRWTESLPEAEYELITAMDAGAFALTPLRNAHLIRPPRALAAAVAFCAERTPWTDPAAVDANYVRRSDAELFWKES